MQQKARHLASPPPLGLSRRQKLRWRMLMLLGGILLLTLLVIAASVFYFIYQNEYRIWQSRQRDAARHASETVAAFLQRINDFLILTGSLHRNDLITNPQVMSQLLEQNPALLELIRVDTNGSIFASAYQDRPVLANLFTVPQARWFNQAKKGQVYLGEVQISSIDEPYLIMAAPTLDGGVVATRLRLDRLWEVVADIEFGRTGQAYVVNRAGQIIAHAEPAVALAHTSLAGRPEMLSLLQASHQEWSGAYVNFKDIEVVGVTAPVAGTDWVVITELSRAEAFATSRIAFLLLGGGMAILGVLVMLVTSRFLGRLILQPMEQLQAGAARIGAGDLSHRIKIAQQNEVAQVAIAFNDMADRLQKHQQSLIQARDQALEASRLKTELLAKVSHELRTPLGAILGYTELLQEGTFGSLSEQQIGITAEVVDSTHYLTDLVAELLDQAQVESGRVTLEVSPFALKDLVDQVEAKMRVLAQVKGLALSFDIAAEVPPILSGDQHRLQQILINLVSNAIKFTRAGVVAVRFYRPDPEHWAMQVTDTGPGIPEEAQAYIFEPFQQVDGSMTREHRGTGLGLSIVKQLATVMGGQVTLESQLGQGSTFTILLPLTPIQEQKI